MVFHDTLPLGTFHFGVSTFALPPVTVSRICIPVVDARGFS
jgi:hypothetical protein